MPVPRSAGAMPKTMPVTPVMARTKPSTRQSNAAACPVGARGSSCLSPIPDDDAERAADRREQQALGQQLPDQPPARRAERQPDRHLFLPGRRARQQQVRDVGADDQQHQGDDDAEDRHRAHSFVLTS